MRRAVSACAHTLPTETQHAALATRACPSYCSAARVNVGLGEPSTLS